MSKFIDAVKCKFGNMKFAGNMHFDNKLEGLSVQEGVSASPSFGSLQRDYVISVSYAQKGNCYPEDYKHLQEGFLRQLKQELYSETRSIEQRITRAFYERDIDGIESALRDLRQEIY